MSLYAVKTFLISALVTGAVGHQCHDGSRVTCTAVVSSNGAPSTHGEGYSADGYPTCTTSGQRVFCLFDHDYHTCGSGQEPCCMDGSNPSHHHAFIGDDHQLDCSATTEATETVTEEDAFISSAGLHSCRLGLQAVAVSMLMYALLLW
eukprot:gnl/TRDRNA2_/TRDRNA2_80985_c0_seq1.p1 gnl/TRDRNA2_/TRDRNA2_80985_c0~~gnl/TRDRNA2_/TRDRNA2_80985_c0_seq1.p1  ORF type:complete len:148 (-),score=6.64 gnl/TRDRNA2_/TRDRNA2_80985_c0_seq1:75-518(-)